MNQFELVNKLGFTLSFDFVYLYRLSELPFSLKFCKSFLVILINHLRIYLF